MWYARPLLVIAILLLSSGPLAAQHTPVWSPVTVAPPKPVIAPRWQPSSEVAEDGVQAGPLSDVPVILLSTIGAGVLAFSVTAACFEVECGLTRFEVALGAGAATGAVAGAWIGGRRPAPLHTAAGAALGTAATILVNRAAGGKDADVRIVLSSAVLPVIGAWIGNGRGQ